MNLPFKAALIGKFGSQISAARKMDLSEWRISRIVNGWDAPREDEMKVLADALGGKILKKLLRQGHDGQKARSEKQEEAAA